MMHLHFVTASHNLSSTTPLDSYLLPASRIISILLVLGNPSPFLCPLPPLPLGIRDALGLSYSLLNSLLKYG